MPKLPSAPRPPRVAPCLPLCEAGVTPTVNPIQSLLQWASPAGPKARLSVLVFHRVLPQPDPLFPQDMHASLFHALCGWLASWFQVLPLDVAVAQLKNKTLPARAACITFDDGYADNRHVALPLLKQHQLPATFFIATDFVNGGCMWNDRLMAAVRACPAPQLDLQDLGLACLPVRTLAERRAAIFHLIEALKYQPLAQRAALADQVAQRAGVAVPDDLMMTSADLLHLRHSGMQIGAHTMSHPVLARLDDAQARHEIQGSQQFLQQLLGERVSLFAYPNGQPGVDYGQRHVEQVRRLGFEAAVSTQWGASTADDDPFQIRRFTPWDTTRWRFAARMLANMQAQR